VIAVQIARDAGRDLHVGMEVLGVDDIRIFDVGAQIKGAAEAVGLPEYGPRLPCTLAT
jgi:hypothetical protein